MGKRKGKTQRQKGQRKQRGQRETEKLLTAKDVMNAMVLSIRDDASVEELATFLTENEISGAPVVDSRGRLVGVVSLRDIVGKAAESGDLASGRAAHGFYTPAWEGRLARDELSRMHIVDEGFQVREIMTPSVYSVSEDTPVSEIARTMISGHIHRLLVTRDRQAVGIVTTLDLLKLLISSKFAKAG